MNRLVPYYLPAFFVLLISQAGWGQMIIGHRGASHDAPENTLAAFQEAWAQGADGIEGDFYFTRDNKIVCIHDNDTQRTSTAKLVIRESTLSQLQKLEFGAWKSPKFAGEPIPTFADVLGCVPPGKTFVIELKTGPEIVPLLHRELEAAEVDLQQLLIIAFDANTIAKCKELLPDVRAHWLTGYKRDKPTGQVHPTVDEIAATLAACRADGLGTHGDRSIVTPEFIASLRQHGMREFHVWTIDSPEDAQYFQALGAVGITTNRPQFIRAALPKASSE